MNAQIFLFLDGVGAALWLPVTSIQNIDSANSKIAHHSIVGADGRLPGVIIPHLPAKHPSG
jgi:hypothetical protein